MSGKIEDAPRGKVEFLRPSGWVWRPEMDARWYWCDADRRVQGAAMLDARNNGGGDGEG